MGVTEGRRGAWYPRGSLGNCLWERPGRDSHRDPHHHVEIGGEWGISGGSSLHPDKRAWTGTFAARDGAAKTVRLERPRPVDHVPGSPLSGVWKSATGDGCLHLAAGSSGTVYAWLDRVEGSTERRYGEMLEPQKITAERIVLQLSTATAPTYEFTGSLGKDGMRIEGQWTPGLVAPTVNDAGRLPTSSDPAKFCVAGQDRSLRDCPLPEFQRNLRGQARERVTSHDPQPFARTATVIRWMPTNSSSGDGPLSTSRQRTTASRMRSTTASNELACVWQPRSCGTEAM
jgi:hypothetical protein